MNITNLHKIIISSVLSIFLPIMVFSQSIDLKLAGISSGTPYISENTIGLGAGAEYNITNKFSTSLNFSSLSNSAPIYVSNNGIWEKHAVDFMSARNKIAELNVMYSLLGSRNKLFSTKAGAGLVYQITEMDVVRNGLFELGEVISIERESSTNLSACFGLYLVQQFNLSPRFFISVGVSAFIQKRQNFPLIEASVSSTDENSTRNTSYSSIDAPFNNLTYSLSIGTRIFGWK